MLKIVVRLTIVACFALSTMVSMPMQAYSFSLTDLIRIPANTLDDVVKIPTVTGTHSRKKGLGIVGGIIGGVIAYCAAFPKNCSGGKPKRGYGPKSGGKSGSKGGGPRKVYDAVVLDRSQKMLIQEGLQALGFYRGKIDGDFGRGTRGAIKSYQKSVGAAATGALTEVQIRDLMLAGPSYAGVKPDDDRMFEVEFVMDLSRSEIATLQRMLNEAGYGAGPVDGALGSRTYAAVKRYKRDFALGGSDVPTKRLLARLTRSESGSEGTGIASIVDPIEKRDGDQGIHTKDATETDGKLAAIGDKTDGREVSLVTGPVVSLDISGMRTGTLASEVGEIASEKLDGEFRIVTASADAFGGDSILSYGMQVVSAKWPAPFSSQMTILFDEAFPEYGAIAVFRTFSLPDGITEAQITSDVIPQVIDKYGEAGRVPGHLIWISDNATRQAVTVDSVKASACGELQLLIRKDAETGDDWESGNGPQLSGSAAEGVNRKCGDVLRVDHDEANITLSLWNSDYIVDRRAAEVAGEIDIKVPKLKF